MRGTILGAAIATVVAFSYAAYGLIIDPVWTPLRVAGAVLLGTALGAAWGRAIWNWRQH
jgi:hypothetical protein